MASRQTQLPVGLQLYSVREQCAEDLPGVLKQLAEWGFDGVEFAGFHDYAGEDVRCMLDDTGLQCCGSHARWELLGDNVRDRTLQTHRAIGCTYLIVPGLPPELRQTRDACLQTAERLSDLTQQLEAEGFRFGYHAHDADMKPIDGGKPAWDLLAENTPDSFIMQYDTANGMAGGADPVAPLRRYPGRGVTVHLKEYSKAEGHGVGAIGEGDVPWADVFDACETTAGTQWYIVEQEGHRTLSPMDAAHASLEGFRGLRGERQGS